MGYMHAMTSHTEGINPISSVKWRSFDAMMGVFWEAEGKSGATGYYTSPDPRVMLFFNDVSEHILIGKRQVQPDGNARPMLQALYVPASVPMWSRFANDHKFSHLDLHINKRWLVDRLTPVFGQAEAPGGIACSVETQDILTVLTIATALKQEIIEPKHHPLYFESLAIALITSLLSPPISREVLPNQFGGITPSQMKKLHKVLENNHSKRVSKAALADAIGLSSSWFSHAFKETTGKTPLQWQQECRIAKVKTVLLKQERSIADAAAQFGFADQAHLTRVFRSCEGITPAVWIRENLRR